MYYILADHVRLTGYLKLPFAIHNLRTSRTEFLNRELFTLVYHCDGKHDIDPDTLPEDERLFLDHLVGGGFVLPCEEGTKLKPYQEYRYYDNRFKETVHWSVTGRCNYRCKHCFMSAPDAKFGHPSTEQCLSLISQMEECGIATVSLTGGEPLIREDFPQLVAALTEHHVRITSILTNGALVDEGLLDMLESNHQHPSFQMSYDGLGWHDWMRGVDGAEQKVLDAFRLLADRGYGTSSSMAMHRESAKVLRESVLKLAEVGCSSLKVNVANPSGEWLKHPEYFMTLEEGYQTYLDYIPQYFADGAPLALMLEGAFNYEPGAGSYDMVSDKMSEAKLSSLPVCGSLRKMVYVGPEGVILPCQSMIAAPIFDRYPNVYESSLKEILRDSEYIRDVCSNVSDFMDRNPECATCEHARHCCGGCRAMGVGAYGTDFMAPDMRVCGFYKQGWYDRFKALCDVEMQKFREAGGVERCRERMRGKDPVPQEEC